MASAGNAVQRRRTHGPTRARPRPDPLGNPDGPASGRWDTGIAEDLPALCTARRQAPPELAGTVQRGNQNVPHERPDPPGYKVSLFCRDELRP